MALILVAWLSFGAAVGLWEARHGHWSVVTFFGALAGPFALILVPAWRKTRSAAHPRLVQVGYSADGWLNVTVGIDGSAEAEHALDTAIELFGPGMRYLTLATVIDFDTATATQQHRPPVDERERAEAVLAKAGDRVEQATGINPDELLLVGDPAEALTEHVRRRGGLLVVGHRGHGMSNALVGSVASHLTRHGEVPVLIDSNGKGASR